MTFHKLQQNYKKLCKIHIYYTNYTFF